MNRKEGNFPFLWTGYSKLRQPAVISGGERFIPELRPAVIERIKQRVADAGTKGIRQDFSNGEFISSSLIVGTSLNSVADRSLDLDGAGDMAYLDCKLMLWWREGGCFD